MLAMLSYKRCVCYLLVVKYNYYYLLARCVYTMLCMLEWMWKGKHRIGTSRTQGLRGSALMAYIHEGIPYELHLYYV